MSLDPLPARLALEPLPLRAALVDAAGCLVWCNAAARAAWGDPAAGTALADLAPKAARGTLHELGLALAWEPEGDALLETLRCAAGESATLAHEIRNARSAVHLALRAVARALSEDEAEVLADLVRRLEGVERRIREALGDPAKGR